MQVLISRLFVVVRIHPTETRAQTSLEWDFDKFMAVNSARSLVLHLKSIISPKNKHHEQTQLESSQRI